MAYVLIVDDDEDFAGAAARVLRGEGHEVAVQLETETAVERMTQRRPDLLILDVMFPESSSAGFQLAQKLCANEDLKDIPILMLTAVNQKFPLGFSPNDIDDEWLPVTDFLEKPVALDVLKAKVAGVLEQAGTAGGQAAAQA